MEGYSGTSIRSFDYVLSVGTNYLTGEFERDEPEWPLPDFPAVRTRQENLGTLKLNL